MRTIICNGHVVTMDRDDRIFPDGVVVLDGSDIVWVGPREECGYLDDAESQTIDASNCLVIPGIVNAHTHNVYYLMRGLGMDRELKEWLMTAIWPGLLRIDRQAAYAGSLLGCLENIRSGVTCVADNYYMHRERKENIDGVLEAAWDSGIRLVMARGFHDFPFNVPEEFLESADEILDEYRRMVSLWHGQGDRTFVTLSPVNLLYTKEGTLAGIGELAREYSLGIHTHVAEARFEVEEIRNRFGTTYIEMFDRWGLVNEKFNAVHSVFLTEPEMKILHDRGGSVILNPASNMLLASGIAPVHQMKEQGVLLALGTDAPNNNQDMLESMKLATILPRVIRNNPVEVTSYEALQMATIQGAKALGLDHMIGSLEVGKRADVAVISMEHLHNTPTYDPVANLVYSANQSDVRFVLVDGKLLLKDGQLVWYDEMDVAHDTQQLCRALFRDLV